jgi:putative ABC transport system substrate-binding protein
MERIIRNLFLRPYSDNRKSKSCPFDKLRAGSEPCRRIEHPKWLGLSLVAFVLVVSVAVAQAQQSAKIHRIGLLSGGSPGADPRIDVIRQGLRQLGYVEGQNITFEFQWAEGRNDRFADLAAALVRLNPDIIVVTTGEPAIIALKQATNTIPIVMTSVGDPIGRGFIASLARPGGNITGVSNQAVELTGKWLELLKESAPKVAEVAVLRNPANPTHVSFWREAQIAAQGFGLKVQDTELRSPDNFETVFGIITKTRASGLVVLPDPMTFAAFRTIADLATKHRLSAISMFKEFAEAGGLLAYGANLIENARRAPIYVDKILKGAKPAELPVEQPMKFDFVINLKTAKQIGLTIPPNVVARADRVIR